MGVARLLVSIWIVPVLVGCTSKGSIDISDVFRKGQGPNWEGLGGGIHRDHFRDVKWALPPRLVWKLTPSSSVGASMVISDSLVYFTTLDGRFHSVNLRNGHHVGQIRYMHASTAGLAVHHQTAVIGIGAGRPTLLVYDLFERRYRHMTDIGAIDSNPIVEDDRLYVASQDRNVYCMNIMDGQVVWKSPLPKPSRSSPVIWDNTIFIGCDDGRLYALEKTTGRPTWSVELHSPIFASPAVDERSLYVGTLDGELVALDRVEGHVRWRFRIGIDRAAAFYCGVALDESNVYAAGSDGGVYAVDKMTGSLVWKFATGGAISVSPVVTQNLVFVGSQDFFMYAISTATGNMEWSFKASGRIKTNPAIYGDYLLFAAEGKTVYAFKFE